MLGMRIDDLGGGRWGYKKELLGSALKRIKRSLGKFVEKKTLAGADAKLALNKIRTAISV